VAAALLAQDPELARAYLEEAIEKEPNSPSAWLALLNLQRKAGDPHASVLASIEALKAADPTSVLPWCHAAALKLRDGDLDGVFAELRLAAEKPRVNDYVSKHLAISHDFYRDAGQPESVAKMLAAFGLKVENLAALRELGAQVENESEARLAAGNGASALALLEAAVALGGKLSTSGQLLIQEAVGMRWRIRRSSKSAGSASSSVEAAKSSRRSTAAPRRFARG
jgi:hypothetical protein